MAFRIGNYVVRGELRNKRPNSVSGWIDFGGDSGIRLDLTGDFSDDLAGRHIRFESKSAGADRKPADSDYLEDLHPHQIGPTGDMTLRMVRVPLAPINELMQRARMGEPAPTVEKPCLYLEWFSQNGRVVAEIIDPQIEFVDELSEAPGEPVIPPPPSSESEEEDEGPSIIGFVQNDEGEFDELSLEEPDDDADEFGLFPATLENEIRDSARSDRPASDDTEHRSGPLSWDEVIPGIDEETKRLYEQWDEVVHGEKDEPLTTLFDPPIHLPRPDELETDEQALPHLKNLLARLAMLSVAFDMCEHCTPRMAYRILIEEILPEASLHPDLANTGFVQHYSSFESCPECEAEFDREFRGESEDL